MSIQDVVARQHQQNVAQVQRSGQQLGMSTDILGALDKLTRLGANVTRNDVMESIMQFVEAGKVSPKQAAIFMGQVPMQGPALAEWIKAKEAAFVQQHQKLTQAHAQANKNMGVTALHSLAMMMGAPAQVPQDNALAAPTPNPMSPQNA